MKNAYVVLGSFPVNDSWDQDERIFGVYDTQDLAKKGLQEAEKLSAITSQFRNPRIMALELNAIKSRVSFSIYPPDEVGNPKVFFSTFIKEEKTTYEDRQIMGAIDYNGETKGELKRKALKKAKVDLGADVPDWL